MPVRESGAPLGFASLRTVLSVIEIEYKRQRHAPNPQRVVP